MIFFKSVPYVENRYFQSDFTGKLISLNVQNLRFVKVAHVFKVTFFTFLHFKIYIGICTNLHTIWKFWLIISCFETDNNIQSLTRILSFRGRKIRSFAKLPTFIFYRLVFSGKWNQVGNTSLSGLFKKR